ncbi:hypothetical protein B0H13DRAFT_2372947 [Mycena leptocephala]|nr:hypothetical protein B0H13DRAFT_2372947 [Mycena leptocephala]
MHFEKQGGNAPARLHLRDKCLDPSVLHVQCKPLNRHPHSQHYQCSIPPLPSSSPLYISLLPLQSPQQAQSAVISRSIPARTREILDNTGLLSPNVGLESTDPMAEPITLDKAVSTPESSEAIGKPLSRFLKNIAQPAPPALDSYNQLIKELLF